MSSELRISDGGRSVPIAQVFFGYDVGTGVIYQDDNIKVTVVENTHFKLHQAGPAVGKYKSYSYRFDTPDRVVVFTGDTGPSNQVTELAKGADLLVSEVNSVEDRKHQLINNGQWQVMTAAQQAGIMRQATEAHMTADAIGKMATRANVKTVLLPHLTERPGSDDSAQRVDELRKYVAGQVLVAKDLIEF